MWRHDKHQGMGHVMDDALSEPIWQFLRGGRSVTDFEAWFYQNEVALLPYLGEELHQDLLWLDFKNYRALLELAPRLEQVVTPYMRCECPRLGQQADFLMGSDGQDARFHATVKERVSGGEAMYWLKLGQCTCCGQNWMVANDQTIFDLYLADRVSPEEAEAIVTTGQWPETFSSYERVLELCITRGGARSRLRAEDWLAHWVVKELKTARESMTNAEIAVLFGLSDADVAVILGDKPADEPPLPRRSWWQRWFGG